jgi:glycosyltransferase involved in cell wall biosynthesis
MTYNISIGILAHNAAPNLTKTLASLRQQSIFYLTHEQYRVEIVLMANGCTDNTATIAEQIFAQREWQDLQARVTCRVCEQPTAGNSHAWNHYIHEFSHAATNYFVLMQSDIIFGEAETIEYLVQQLVIDPRAWVSIDQPIKHVQLRQQRNPIQSLSAQMPLQTISQAKGITGQLYCARAYKLRQIWMPQGVTIEDGFLRAMILTDRFTGAEDFDRIVFTPGASHIFEAQTGIRGLLRHEQRIVMGTIVNQFLFDYFWATCCRTLDAGTLIRRQNDRDPRWIDKLIQDGKQAKGWWLLHSSQTFRRFSDLMQHPSYRQRLQRLPIAAAASIADWAVFWRANQALHQSRE